MWWPIITSLTKFNGRKSEINWFCPTSPQLFFSLNSQPASTLIWAACSTGTHTPSPFRDLFPGQHACLLVIITHWYTSLSMAAPGNCPGNILNSRHHSPFLHCVAADLMISDTITPASINHLFVLLTGLQSGEGPNDQVAVLQLGSLESLLCCLL